MLIHNLFQVYAFKQKGWHLFLLQLYFFCKIIIQLQVQCIPHALFVSSK